MGRLKKDEVMVIGGAGFIGSHLVERLLDAGHKVTVLDIKIEANSYFVKKKLLKKIDFEFCDIRNFNDLFELIEKYSPKFIFHLAAEPIVRSALENPLLTFETNIMGTVNVLESVRRLGNVTNVIIASTDKAYGKTSKPYSEDSPLKGDHPYDVSKSSADLISQAYFKTYATPTIVTRFGNVYGEGDFHMSRIVPGIFESIIKNKILLIRSNGKYIRDYIYIEDVVNGYLFLMKNFGRLEGNAFNFSSDKSLSVIRLIEEIEEIIKVKVKFKILNTAKNEIPYQHLKDDKIRKFGFKNNFAFEQGIKKTFDWYKENLINV